MKIRSNCTFWKPYVWVKYWCIITYICFFINNDIKLYTITYWFFAYFFNFPCCIFQKRKGIDQNDKFQAIQHPWNRVFTTLNNFWTWQPPLGTFPWTFPKQEGTDFFTEILRENFQRWNFIHYYFEVFWAICTHFYSLKRFSFQVLCILKSVFDWILARSLGTEFMREKFHRHFFIECYFKLICVIYIKF